MRSFLDENCNVARVEVIAVNGSTPREAGAWMLVTTADSAGTIGGGQLEYRAIDAARALLTGETTVQRVEMALGPEIGQCCGGQVTLSISTMDAGDRARLIDRLERAANDLPVIHVFGAGHVGRALVTQLQSLPVRVHVVDTRDSALRLLPDGVTRTLSAIPESIVAGAEPGGAYVILTHDHGLDFLIASAALGRGDARYVGMIGSKTKRASFASWCRKNATGAIDLNPLVCPIGVRGSADKRPEVIAAFVAAEIIETLTTPRP